MLLEMLLPLLLLLLCIRIAQHTQRASLAAAAFAVGTWLVWTLLGEAQAILVPASAILFLLHWGLFALLIRFDGTFIHWLALAAMFLLLGWWVVFGVAFAG